MDVTRIRKKAVQKDKLQEGINCFGGVFVFIYPDNLKEGHPAAVASWPLSGGLSALCIGAGPDGTMLPLGTVLYAFLAIQVEGSSVLDFLRRAACFLFLQQQYYEWGRG